MKPLKEFTAKEITEFISSHKEIENETWFNVYEYDGKYYRIVLQQFKNSLSYLICEACKEELISFYENEEEKPFYIETESLFDIDPKTFPPTISEYALQYHCHHNEAGHMWKRVFFEYKGQLYCSTWRWDRGTYIFLGEPFQKAKVTEETRIHKTYEVDK